MNEWMKVQWFKVRSKARSRLSLTHTEYEMDRPRPNVSRSWLSLVEVVHCQSDQTVPVQCIQCIISGSSRQSTKLTCSQLMHCCPGSVLPVADPQYYITKLLSKNELNSLHIPRLLRTTKAESVEMDMSMDTHGKYVHIDLKFHIRGKPTVMVKIHQTFK